MVVRGFTNDFTMQQRVLIMQISRHWRLNANRYRLEGFSTNGVKSIQARANIQNNPASVEQPQSEPVNNEKKAQRVAA